MADAGATTASIEVGAGGDGATRSFSSSTRSSSKSSASSSSSPPKISRSKRNGGRGGPLARTSKKSKCGNGKNSSSVRWPISRLLTARILFVLCLCTVAAVLGYLAYLFLRKSERELAVTQFVSLSKRALNDARKVTLRMRNGAITLASLYSNAHPDATVGWPNVAIDGFNEISSYLVETVAGMGFGFAPIVYPSERESFEEFAYDYYQTKRRPPFESSESVGVSSFGKGVYGSLDFAPASVKNATAGDDGRYHDMSGTTSWGSSYQFLVPMFQLESPGAPSLRMKNMHNDVTTGQVIDGIKRCSDVHENEHIYYADHDDDDDDDGSQRHQHVSIGGRHGSKAVECSGISDPKFFYSQTGNQGPGAVIMDPIFPANDPTVVRCFFYVIRVCVAEHVKVPLGHLYPSLLTTSSSGFLSFFVCYSRTAVARVYRFFNPVE